MVEDPVPGPDFAVTMEPRAPSPVDIAVQVAAAVPLPEDADRDLQVEDAHGLAPRSPYAVALPTVRLPRPVIEQLEEHESDGFSSRASTPEEARHEEPDHGHAHAHEEENLAPVPDHATSEKELIANTDISTGEKMVPAAERAFAEVDINALVR